MSAFAPLSSGASNKVGSKGAVIIPGRKLPVGAESKSPAALLPVDHEMAVNKHCDGMPLPSLLDTLKARDGVVLRMTTTICRTTSALREAKSKAKSFAGPLF